MLLDLKPQVYMPSQFWSIGYITFSKRMLDSCGKLFASTGHTFSSIFIKTLTRGVVTKTRNGTRNGKEQGMEWNNKWNGLFFSNMEWNEKLNVEWNGTDVGWYASSVIVSFPVHTHLLMLSMEELSGNMN